MGGKNKGQPAGYKYFTSMAMAIGNRIENLLGINFDKRGWQVGNRTDLGLKGIDCYISKPNLYGENEGGIAGNIRIHLGQNDQEADEHYQIYFPLVSAYPYQSYLVFGAPTTPDISGLLGGGFIGSIAEALTNTGPGFYVGNSGFLKEMMLWPKRIHVKNDGTVQWYDAYAEIGSFFDFSESKYPRYTTPTDVDIALRYVNEKTSGNNSKSYTFSGVSDQSHVALTGFTSGGELAVVQAYSPQNITINYSTFAEYMIVKIIFTIVNQSKIMEYELRGIVIKPPIVSVDGSNTYVTAYFFVLSDYMPAIQVRFSDAVVTGGTQAVFGGNVSSRLLDAYIPGYTEAIYAPDMNPIHKIREILTDDTAMNKPEVDINDTNFMAAAERIFSEGLGISWAITEKSCKEALDELCNHIEAGVRVNRQTGRYEIILFRDDWYDLNTAQSFNENNIKTLQLDIANSDETINTLNVNYYDRANIKKSAFNVAEIGLIHTLGHENAETIDFPYFTKRRNAEIVANWKLKQLSTPAWAGAFTTGSYEARKLNRYDVIKLNWSSKGIVNLPVRIMKISLGDGRDNTVTIDFVEVVPYSEMTTTTINVDPPVVQPGLEPQINQSVVFEMPYLEAVQQVGQLEVDNQLANNSDISYLMVATKRPQDNSLNALLYTDAGVGYERASRVDYCATADLDQSIGYLENSFAVKNTSAMDQVTAGSVVLVDEEIMVFQSYDLATKIMTVKRGALDTIPKPHAQNAVFYFYDNFASFDMTQYVQSEIIKAKVLTTTPSGVLDLADASELSLTMQARAIRPYPPANVKIDGVYYPENISGANIVLTWVDRNRLQQTGGDVLGYFDPGVTIESGVTYQLQVYLVDSENVETEFFNQDIGTVNTYSLDISTAPAGTQRYRVILKASKNGYESFQHFEHVLNTQLTAPYSLTVEYT